MPDAPAFTRVGIIGTGRVARALGELLAPFSREPLLVWGRTPAHRDNLAEELGKAEAVADMAALAGCDVVMIAVADDAMSDVIATLAAEGPFSDAPLAFHVSGRSGAAILDPLARLGALTAALHPVMTFTGNAAVDVPNVGGAHFAVTAIAQDARAKGQQVVTALGGVAVEIAEKDRALYHAALCHTANHLVTLISQGSAMLETAGVPHPAATVGPLVKAALTNSLDHGFAALSGPLLRGDTNTIRSHIDALGVSCPEILPAYRAMALATLERMENEGRPIAPEVREVLE